MKIADSKTYNEHFGEIVRKFPDRVAFKLKTPQGYRQVNYREVYRQVVGVARGLIAMGLGPGERVAILSENRPEWVIAFLGIFLARGVAVPLDAQISPAEWRRLLDDSESRSVFVSGHLLAKLKEAVQDSALLNSLVCLDSIDGANSCRLTLGEMVDWAASLDPLPSLPAWEVSDLLMIIYTSGTTGSPKGVMITQENVLGELHGIFEAVQVDERENLLCLLPLQHIFASIINVLTPLYVGAQVTFADTLKRSEILEALESAEITILATVPQFFYLFHGRIQEELAHKPAFMRGLFRAMLLVSRFCQRVLRINLGKLLFGRIHQLFGSKLRLFVSGGSSLDPKVTQDFHDLGFTILQGYGLTEASGGSAVTRVENNVIGSCGPALSGVHVSILAPDEEGTGEILIRGPVVMKGYYKRSDLTAEAIRDGWLHTGDLGRLDARGNLFVTGRQKEIIIPPSGKNIYPDEIEAHYLQCPYIKEIAVLGVSTPGSYQASERLHAVVVPDFDYMKANKIVNAREILRDEIGRLSNQLPKYKRLMRYQIQKEPLPRTTTRKIRRLELKRLIETGQLRGAEAGAAVAETAEDQALRGTAVGQEVLRALRETHNRNVPIDLAMNLELDLGFDSMERVELLANLEESLSLKLPDDFGADILTVRDLISRLEAEVGMPSGGAQVSQQSWKTILSEEVLARDGDCQPHFVGALVALIKYLGLRVVYVLSRILLRLEVHGKENLPAKPPYLICPNHLSYVDPFIVMSVLPYRVFKKVFFVGASEFFQGRWMKLLARLANTAPVDPDSNLLRAMKVGAYVLRRSRILCIFPEGSRAFDGELQEFKKGAAILASEVGAPVIPVGIRGTYEVWPRGNLRIRLHRVKVTFGSPRWPETGDSHQTTTDKLRAAVRSLIDE